MNEAIARHCEELNCCNQRGGRMLSIFDLLEAETLDLDLAAYLMSRISRGASFMVSAVPGGAGKTTVMCALLNFVPIDVRLVAATADEVYQAVDRPVSQKKCYICHEIGSGPYYAYLWSDALRAYCSLSDQGYMLATNLHADDLNEARDQVCITNEVPIDHFNKFELLIFLKVKGGYFNARRWIDLVYSSDGSIEHEIIYTSSEGLKKEILETDTGNITACRNLLSERKNRDKTIEQARKCIVDFLGQNPI